MQTNILKITTCLLLLFGGYSCKKAPVVFQTSDEVNITGYLEKDPGKFSEFLKILHLTGDAGFLSIYGAYTVFVPTNDAIAAYLEEKGMASVESIDVQELKNLSRFHMLEDTISTTSFSDGKLPGITMYGQYLITGAVNTAGNTRMIVNRQAGIIQGNIRAGNGIIHVIDHVLQPAEFTMAQMIANDTKYTIFTQALQETGLYDTLNILPAGNTDSTRKWLTVLAETDAVLNGAGFGSYAALKAKYCNTGNPKDVQDSLHLFVNYHILHEAKYLADIVSATSHTTLAPLEVVTAKLSGQKVLINDDVFNGVHEPGVELDRAGSDNSASNGVLHNATGHYAIKVRNPVPVYWEVADFPEMRNLPAYYKKQNYTFSLANMPEDVTVPGPSAMTYAVGGTYVNGHYLMIPLGGPGRSAWVQLRTPLLVRGKYKVWICYRTQKQSGGSNNVNQVSIDGEVLQNTMNFTLSMPATTEGEMEAQGWKWYTSPTANAWAGRLVGTVEIKTTDRHLLRFTTLQGTQNNNNLNMIHFIPQDMDQLYPRFEANGTPVPRP